MKNYEKTILLYSGGVDSYVAWEACLRPETLYVNLGHKYWKKEVKAVIDTIPSTKIIDCKSIGKYEKDDAEIPARNLLLATLAAMEGADRIILVVQKDEMSIPDRTKDFFLNTSVLLSRLMGREITLMTPFEFMDKTEMISWYVDQGLPMRPLLDTVGCYDAAEGHCGNCSACLRRYIAFMNNGIDPGYELSTEIRVQYLESLSSYSVDRQERMRKWL